MSLQSGKDGTIQFSKLTLSNLSGNDGLTLKQKDVEDDTSKIYQDDVFVLNIENDSFAGVGASQIAFLANDTLGVQQVPLLLTGDGVIFNGAVAVDTLTVDTALIMNAGSEFEFDSAVPGSVFKENWTGASTFNLIADGQLVNPTSISFQATQNVGLPVEAGLVVDGYGIIVPAGLLRQTDNNVPPGPMENRRVVFGTTTYDQNLSENSTVHIFRDTDATGVVRDVLGTSTTQTTINAMDTGVLVSSMTITPTATSVRGVLSTGNTVITLENTPATQSLTSGALHQVYNSGVLPVGVYMVSTSCSFYKPGPVYLTGAEIDIQNSASVVSMTGGSITVDNATSLMTEWGGQATLLWTSDGTNTFLIEVQANTGDGSDFGILAGGRTQFIKIA